MEDLLFLSHRIPYPPNKGDKIRSWNILKYLARSYRIHLGAFVDDPRDLRYRDRLASMCASVYLPPLHPATRRVCSLSGLIHKLPLSIPYYHDRSMQEWVDSRLQLEGLQRIFVFSSPMAQFVMNRRASSCRRVIDFVDVDSDKWRQYADHKHWPLSWLYRREAEQLLMFEKRVAMTFDSSIFVSAMEAELFKRLVPEAEERTGFLDNGVDGEYFSAEMDYVTPYDSQYRIIVFTGVMDYWANVHAVQWFARYVMPKVREAGPSARFVIVGARPSGEVQKLADLPSVVVTGAVPDVRPYLAHAHVAVAPLRIARGVQNKVLEAMAMAKAVVATPAAVEGIEFTNHEVLQVVESDKEFASRVIHLLGTDMPVSAPESRQWVAERYDWNRNLDRIGALLESAPRQGQLPDVAGRRPAFQDGRPA
ncbi:MAG: TIGR03087 family PEP-CTERM/XrtA system glycosyltransferase [Thiohalobacterales bacterium]|nr:TIGR03087 family PEP-CTERM/XrtA system glycosyltransferase [Thiohalobacterales bacterium]